MPNRVKFNKLNEQDCSVHTFLEKYICRLHTLLDYKDLKTLMVDSFLSYHSGTPTATANTLQMEEWYWSFVRSMQDNPIALHLQKDGIQSNCFEHEI